MFKSSLVACSIALLFIALTSSVVQSQTTGDHRYKVGDLIPLHAAKLWPFGNPSETYSFDRFAFCQPASDASRPSQDLGKDISGTRMVELSGYRLPFRQEVSSAVVCPSFKLTQKQTEHFRDTVKRSFVLLLYFDGLPITVPVGRATKDGSLFLYTHWQIKAAYNGDQVIEVDIVPDQSKAINLNQDSPTVRYTYSLKWEATTKSFSSRRDRYLKFMLNPGEVDVQWFSIINSLILVVVLTGFLAFIMRRILMRDYDSYLNRDLEAEVREDSGWKLLHGDVFRFPKNINLLSAILGNGAQLLSLSVLFLLLAVVGAFYPDYSYSSLYTALVIIYILTTGISGYVSQKYYIQFGGDRWVSNVLLTVALFALPVFVVWALNNTIAILYQSTVAIPFKTIAAILALYFIISFPLQLVGAITAKNFGNKDFNAPCRTKLVPRQIPPAPWWASGFALVLLSGLLPFAAIYIELNFIFISLWGSMRYTPYPILLIMFFILVMVTSCVSITMTYLQLAHHENHRWWWRSVFYGGSVAFFIFAYSIHFYMTETAMSGTLQTSFFIGVNFIISLAFFLMMGTVGFMSSLVFVKRIFGAIRVD